MNFNILFFIIAASGLVAIFYVIEVIREYAGRFKIMTTRMELLYKGLESQEKQIKILQFVVSDLRDSARRNALNTNETMNQLIEATLDTKQEGE